MPIQSNKKFIETIINMVLFYNRFFPQNFSPLRIINRLIFYMTFFFLTYELLISSIL